MAWVVVINTASSAGMGICRVKSGVSYEKQDVCNFRNDSHAGACSRNTALCAIRHKGNERKITTKRVGPSGTGYSQRLVNCSAGTFKYLGDGETLTEMKASKHGGSMAPLTQGSISYYVAEAACE
ncbi:MULTISPECIES: hypothetical protein [Pseudomonas syringae group]|uniref:hypothetical protein n=1 Tax=Pseudomonas syringae group TaxID=136849 RepID=UPI00217D91BD|nr:hypothetical protein [Pseudomonas syringae group genomosp. 3]